MPIYRRTIKYYTCKFRCGHKARPLHTMEMHEKICFCNPENKACRMCRHYKVDPGYVECELLKYQMANDSKEYVYDQSGKRIYDNVEEMLKYGTDPFCAPQPRPFPKVNCIHFELGKKAY